MKTLLAGILTVYLGIGTVYAAENTPQNILKQALLGAGVGAISAEVSGGKAGTGALVGAGTNVIGGALLDTLLAPAAPSNHVYYSSSPAYATPKQPQKK